jgi:signal transduction histidine kinase/CheY-like chemotaxis protein
VFTRVDDIRQLSLDEASKGLPVDISGTVTWSLPGNDFFFVQDLSGGIRVRYQPGKMETPLRYKYLRIEGVTYNGGFAPAVELRRFKDLGSMTPPPVRDITFDQAISGEEDGQWVRMLGFYQRTESEGDVRRIHAITPSGEFVTIVVSPVNFTATPGTLVRITGICEAVTNEGGGITGILFLTPSLPEIIVEHDAPADFYNLPMRSLRDLRRLNTAREFIRVRVSGSVLYALPGQAVYVEQDGSTVLLLSQDTQPLSPGDRIEAVGILGSEGVRAVLREAIYRRLGPGQPPDAAALADPSRLQVALDSHLVRTRGTLIDILQERDRTRLTLQAGSTIFEAVLNQALVPVDTPAIGAGLEVTGVYRVEYDDSRQARAFQLLLRSARDIAVFQRARLWTVQRALAAAAILGGCIVLGLGWIAALRRRVRKQTEQIRKQLEHQMRLESELQHAARLESLGVLAGGIAHDFNNLLTIILGNVSFAMLDEKAMEVAGGSLRDIHSGAERARDLTQQLLTFAKGGNPLRSTVSLPNIVQDMTEFILRGSNVSSEFDFAANLWNASVDKDQTAQVIQNLVINAVQAMPGGGVVRISLRNEQVAPGFKAALAPGRYIRVTISDTGDGIAPEVLPRIFEPYFSTKRAGSGLGLATVYSIVKKHQGHIEAASTIGRGTTFTVWLPAADPASAVQPPAQAGGAEVLSQGKPARVLLMDDEESIRRLGAILLARMGLEATLVNDGAEAVRLFGEAKAAGRPFDLLILDLTIPGGMGGRATIEMIRKTDPNVPAIVSSGYSNDPVLADFRSYGFQAMVSKPYEVTQLVRAIRELLAQRA